MTTKVEIKYSVPDYNLPDFPVCSGYEVLEGGDFIVISEDWFIQLAKFKNEYKEFCLWYKKMKVEEGS